MVKHQTKTSWQARIKAELRKRSLTGGAWVAESSFSELSYKCFQSPCKVSGFYIEQGLGDSFGRPYIGWKGKIVEPTRATKERLDQRQYTCND